MKCKKLNKQIDEWSIQFLLQEPGRIIPMNTKSLWVVIEVKAHKLKKRRKEKKDCTI